MRRIPIYKKLAAVVFLTAFFIQIFGKAFYIADYYAHPEKYAKNCVNQARPQLHCDGKCQLMKKIQQQEQREQEQQQKTNGPKFEISMLDKTDFVRVENMLPTQEKTTKYTDQSSFYPDGHFAAIFHPPC